MTTSAINLYRLVYLSTSNGEFSEQQLENILTVSRTNNQRRNITGLLVYCSGNILQILEGEQEQLYKVYHTIEKDKRHLGCIKIQDAPISRRAFNQWSMGYASVSKKGFQQLEGYLSVTDRSAALNINDVEGTVKDILEMFLENNK